MEFRQLSYFLAIVETGSVSAASQRVHIAQPALTRQIQLLEESLETRLFDRHARGMRLTLTGQALYEEAQELLDRREQLRSRIAGLSQGAIGRLRLGVTTMLLWQPKITALFGDYRKHFPQVSFEILPLISGVQVECLQQGSLDAGILYLDEESDFCLDTHLLNTDHLVLAVPESSNWAKTPPKHLRELEQTDLIRGYRNASPVYYDSIQKHFHYLGFNPTVKQYGGIDNTSVLSMVAAGLGIAVLPSEACNVPVSGVCVLTLPELDRCKMPLYLAWQSGNDSPALHNLINLVRG